MLQNYEYFLMLAKEQNISHAAEKLFISHQCLSRYLKNLEKECGTMLFERKPAFTLTYAGHVLEESLLQIQKIEQNTNSRFAEIRNDTTGEIRLGITQGRLRIMVPELLSRFQKEYPYIQVKTISEPSPAMIEKLLSNELDMVIAGAMDETNPNLNYKHILDEKLYLVISDNLLRQYFPNQFPECLRTFRKGINLADFKAVPFVLNYPGFYSRKILDNYLLQHHLTLKIVYQATQHDLQHLLTAKDYGASVCITMYIPNIWQLNRENPEDNQLWIFPIKDLTETHPLALITAKEKYLPKYNIEFQKIIKEYCDSFKKIKL